MDPTAAVTLLSGGGGVRSFIDQITPGPARPMPTVAGMQKPNMTPQTPSPMPITQTRSQMPQLAGPAGVAQPMIQQVPGCVDCKQTTFRGFKGLSPSTWPTWLKILVPVALVGIGGAVVYVAVKKDRARGYSGDYEYGY